MDAIYLDHAATTPMHPEVIKVMTSLMEDTFGNPSSIHHYGRKARAQLDKARRYIAHSISAHEKDIYFTSGGTEADNLALIGVALANQTKGNHIITTKIEHHGILRTAEYLESIGFEVSYLPVNSVGLVDPEAVKQALRPDTILVSIMFINNEVGSIQPIKQIGQLLADHQAYFHTDAVQAYGLLPIDVTELGVNLLSASAHKINGPKGVGFLYAQKGIKLQAMQFGGSQERLKRAGTEGLPGIMGMKKAIELIEQSSYQCYAHYQELRELFYQQLVQAGIDFKVNGVLKNSSPTILNLSFPNTHVESVLMNLDLEGIAASSGSACTAGSLESSHVLTAMYGKDDARTRNSIRFSFGLANNREQVIEAADRVVKIIKRLVNQSEKHKDGDL
ncbi:cysteine desulfurase family protein [Amphibacillus sediminis]|uniref:cysteine desulfurase family protein n=1 Tax=Amphibacillus sediminis TaxID=360185 RepID=UPI000829A7A1|nr:cysteine desulfurase family protein [Amphibacillus sediminis]